MTISHTPGRAGRALAGRTTLAARRLGPCAAAAALVAAAAVVGAGLGGGPSDTPTSPRVETVATTLAPATRVLAPPAGFPDLDGLTDASLRHELDMHEPETAFRTSTGLSCRLVTSRGDMSAECYGTIPGVDHPANHVFADAHHVGFEQTESTPDLPDAKPLNAGEKLLFTPSAGPHGGDQITCGVADSMLACIVVKPDPHDPGAQNALRSGFVLDPHGSWTFQLPGSAEQVNVEAETLTRTPPRR